jgi:hypothetical protein
MVERMPEEHGVGSSILPLGTSLVSLSSPRLSGMMYNRIIGA